MFKAWFFCVTFLLASGGVALGLLVFESTIATGLYIYLLGLYAIVFVIERLQNGESELQPWYKAMTPIALALAIAWRYLGPEGITILSIPLALLSIIEVYRFWLIPWHRG